MDGSEMRLNSSLLHHLRSWKPLRRLGIGCARTDVEGAQGFAAREASVVARLVKEDECAS